MESEGKFPAPRGMNTNLVVLIPEFSGSKGGISCRKFLKMIDDYARLENWTDTNKYHILSAKCVGEAGVILDTNPAVVDYATASKALRERFQTPPTLSKVIPMLTEPRQRPDESCRRFADRLKIIRKKSLSAFPEAKQEVMKPLIEETLLATLKKGIRSERIKSSLINLAPQALDAAAEQLKQLEQQEEEYFPHRKGVFTIARDYEDSDVEETGTTPKEEERVEEEIGTALTQVTALIKAAADQLKTEFREPDSSRNTPQRETRQCYECKKVGHIARNCRQKRRNSRAAYQPKCYNCGRPGHKQAECRSPPRQRNENDSNNEDLGQDQNGQKSKNLKRPLSQSK